MTTPEFETFSLEQSCEMTGAPSVDWLRRRITKGETPAVLAGTTWRMTRGDMAVLVEQMREAAQTHLAKLAAGADGRAKRRTASATAPAEAPVANAGLSPRSAARMRRRTSNAA